VHTGSSVHTDRKPFAGLKPREKGANEGDVCTACESPARRADGLTAQRQEIGPSFKARLAMDFEVGSVRAAVLVRIEWR